MIERDKGTTEASLAQLVRLAGVREMPSQEATRRARAAAHEAWQRGMQSAAGASPHVAVRRWWPFALAASCALIMIVVANRPKPMLPQVVASVVKLDAQRAVSEATGEVLAPGMALREGARIRTADGRAAFLLGDSLSLRIDRHTQISFESPDRVRLVHGSLYVDSGGVNSVPRLRVETPAGEIRHLGTQFMVTVEPQITRVRVREGRVIVTRSGEPAREAGAGDAVEIIGGTTRLLRSQPSYGAMWEWAAATAPVFDIENRPLAEFLAWIAREHGWQLAYADDAIRAQAYEIRLHGSVAGLDAAAMLERIELITGVSLRTRHGVLTVGAEPIR